MSDGTNSKIFYTPNVFASAVSWTPGTAYSGAYTLVRPTQTAGGVYIYTPASDAVATEYDFTVSDHGFSVDFLGTYSAGVGWVSTQGQGIPDPANSYRGVGISKSISSTTLLGYILDYTITLGSFSVGHDLANFIKADSTTLQIQQQPGFGAGTHQFNWTGSQAAVTSISTGVYCGVLDGSSSDPGGTVTITRVTLITSAGGGGANVRYSSDYGATFGAPITVGTTPGSIGGFDVQYNGTVSIAAMAGKTRKATTWGGAYSDDQTWTANPKCVVLPFSRRNATTSNNTGSSPDYLVGFDAIDGSGRTLVWVDNVTPSVVDITPSISGTKGIVVGANAITTYLGKFISGLFSFSGTTHWMYSKDGGANYVDRGVVAANYIRVRRLANSPGQLYASGDNGLVRYSNTSGANLVSKTPPTSGADLVFIEPLF